MRVLLDECVPRRLRQQLPEHEVRTVEEQGWGGIKNGDLLRHAADCFDVFLTVDQNLQHQQNLSALPISVIVLVALSNDIDVLIPLMSEVRQILPQVQPGNFYRISE
ncbi:MAG: DUF5615 family PIN-like protein [Gammaproteobacteria bacterium]|nr:DUF5615 family PIN-like protein [Gammaproteobacteria bacterium]